MNAAEWAAIMDDTAPVPRRRTNAAKPTTKRTPAAPVADTVRTADGELLPAPLAALAEPARLRAAVYVPADGTDRWLALCIAYAGRHRYDVVALVVDPDGAKWLGVQQMLGAREVDVVVVARRDHVPADPVMVVAEERSAGPPSRQRTATIPRGDRPAILPRTNGGRA